MARVMSSIEDFPELPGHAERVLDVVSQIPAGRVCTYGLIAECLKDRYGTGSARLVGQVMSRYGGIGPWWRVVRADGTLPRQLRTDALAHYDDEATALVWRHPTKVDLTRALWDPLADA